MKSFFIRDPFLKAPSSPVEEVTLCIIWSWAVKKRQREVCLLSLPKGDVPHMIQRSDNMQGRGKSWFWNHLAVSSAQHPNLRSIKTSPGRLLFNKHRCLYWRSTMHTKLSKRYVLPGGKDVWVNQITQNYVILPAWRYVGVHDLTSPGESQRQSNGRRGCWMNASAAIYHSVNFSKLPSTWLCPLHVSTPELKPTNNFPVTEGHGFIIFPRSSNK